MKWCFIGIHKWIYDGGTVSAFPLGKEETCKRYCFFCNKKQQWLPGYGGSSFGDWITYFEDKKK